MFINEKQLQDFILDSGLVSKKDFDAAKKEAVERKSSTAEMLVNQGKILEDDLRRMEAYVLGIPFVDLKTQKIDFAILSLIPEPIARNHNIVAFKKNDTALEVAMLDTDDLNAIDFVKKKRHPAMKHFNIHLPASHLPPEYKSPMFQSPRTRFKFTANYRFLVLLLAFFLTSLGRIHASPGDLDSTFNPGSGPDDTVQAVAVQNDGKILIAGAFHSFNGAPRNLVARLNADGSLDTSFTSPLTAAGAVYAIALQSDGKILLAGITTANVVRLNTDGTIDTTFKATPDTYAEAVAVQPDGKILIGGGFGRVNGTTAHSIARLNMDGTLDSTFNSGSGANTTGTNSIYTLNVEPNGQVLVGGSFSSFNGFRSAGFIRLNVDGSVDQSLGSSSATINGQNAEVRAFDVAADGAFYFQEFNSRFVKKSLTGTAASDFNGPQLLGTVAAVALATDSKIFVAGSFFTVSSGGLKNIGRLDATGALDSTFVVGSGPDNTVDALALQADGKVLAGGQFVTFNGISHPYLVRLLGGNVPIITSAGMASGQAGAAFNFQVLTDSQGIESYAATGLPVGVTIDSATGAVSGTPSAAGKFTVTLSATDEVGTGTATLAVTIQPPPTVGIQVKGSAMVSEDGATAKLLFSRDGSDLSRDLTVFFKVKGTAREGMDYQTIADSIVIPSGSVSAKLKIKPIRNAVKDGTRLVTIKLSADTNGAYVVNKAAKKATISILDND